MPPISICESAIDSFVGWRADAMSLADQAIENDDNPLLPMLLKGWMLQSSRDESHLDTILSLEARSDALIDSGTQRERCLLDALKLATSGRGIESATCLQTHLNNEPTDIMVHMIAQNQVFWMGRADWMLELAERAAPFWSDATPGFSAFLAVRSFSNEEAGNLDVAERCGRQAVEINPTEVWAAHSVAHVQDTRGNSREGIEWLKGLSKHWTDANQLRHHLWWHICLLLIEEQAYDEILNLLTTEIRNPDCPLIQASPSAPIDIQDYASLLMRLELYGVDVGDYWHALGDVCSNRVHNHGNAFGNTHDMMVLTATGQQNKAEELLASIEDRYRGQTGSVALSYQAVGIPVCKAIIAHSQKQYDIVLDELVGIRHQLSFIGASVVQRDVFFHLLIHAAHAQDRNDLIAVFLTDIERLGFCDVPNRTAYARFATKL